MIELFMAGRGKRMFHQDYTVCASADMCKCVYVDDGVYVCVRAALMESDKKVVPGEEEAV